MALQKALSRSVLLILVIGIIVYGSAVIAGDWETITSFKDVRRILLIDDTLFLATSGGILAISDPDAPAAMYTNTDGLGTVDMSDIIQAADGQKWATGFGQLVAFDGRSSERYSTLPVYGPLYLRRVVDDGDRLWIASDSGLILFSKTGVDGGGFRNRYRITVINPYPAVYDIHLEGDLIWLATANGLAVADRSNTTTLLAPSSWNLFDINTNPELGANEVRRLARFEDSLHLITSGGLFRMSIGVSDTTFIEIPFGSGLEFYDLVINNDSLFIYYSSGLVTVNDGILTVLPSTGMPASPVTGFNTGAFRWLAARSGRGLFENRSGTFEEYIYTGTPGNRVTDIAVDSDGNIAAGFREKRAALRLPSRLWETQEYEPAFYTTNLCTDRSGNLWIGTEGGGLWRTDGNFLVNFNDTNSTVVGNLDNALFAWVTGVVCAGEYLFASLFRVVKDSKAPREASNQIRPFSAPIQTLSLLSNSIAVISGPKPAGRFTSMNLPISPVRPSVSSSQTTPKLVPTHKTPFGENRTTRMVFEGRNRLSFGM